MATQQYQHYQKPNPHRLYGLTHTLDGAPIVRLPRTVKVGIGKPRGKDIHAYINADNQWKVVIGVYEGYKRVSEQWKVFPRNEKEQAMAFYREMKEKAPVAPAPMKLRYFTFSKSMGDSTLEPDWESI